MTADQGRRSRLLVATAMATAPLLALIVARVAWADDLPHTVASPWSGSSADGFSDTDIFFYLVLTLVAVSVAGSVVAAGLTKRRPGVAMWLPAATSVSADVAVRVDEDGLSLSSWGLQWKRIPLAKITSAWSETLRLSEWGGWGYRIAARGSALIPRGGEGLVNSLLARVHAA